ncbi:MAG: chemotaxis protein CheY [Phenylobacterium sp.]|nr:chemotaxis protein CheY [Phenylobacterium sp.]
MPAAANLSILVVDDQRSIRSLVRECLSALGCTRIAECEDGAEALRYLEGRPVHLIISDLNMPNMTGLELLAAVRASPQLKGLGFIMLTSRGEADLVRKAVQLGVNNYLTKPFAMSTLKTKIESVVGRLT